MKVKELRALLSGLDDNADVVVCDMTDKHINLTGGCAAKDMLYLDSVQEFPEDWYDENYLEIGFDYKEE